MNTKNVIELAKRYPGITVSVGLGELMELVNYCIQTTRRELEQMITDANTETYPSPDQVAKILGVDLSTLWRWRKKNYLVPIEVGGKRRYRMSDINKILEKNYRFRETGRTNIKNKWSAINCNTKVKIMSIKVLHSIFCKNILFIEIYLSWTFRFVKIGKP